LQGEGRGFEPLSAHKKSCRSAALVASRCWIACSGRPAASLRMSSSSARSPG